MKKKIGIVLLIIAVLLVATEIYMRSYWGFCDTVLMQKDDKFEYIAQPSQNRFRFRRHIYYNKYSMRSPEIKPNAIKIFGGGDSVINGGAHTDQDSIATTLLTKQLTKELHKDIQVLNISAGSWGPDNVMAYINKYGNFDASIIFLVVSSHDAYDDMDFQEVVGVHPSYPYKQSFSAIYELISRYIMPRILKNKPQGDHITKGNTFNTGFQNLYEYTKSKNIPFFIYLHPDRKEVEDNHYDKQGEAIIKYCKDHNVPLIQGLGFEDLSCFYDEIHPNEKGQRVLANALLPKISELLKE